MPGQFTNAALHKALQVSKYFITFSFVDCAGARVLKNKKKIGMANFPRFPLAQDNKHGILGSWREYFCAYNSLLLVVA